MNVAILGASDNPERYAYKAFKKLSENGHHVFLVNPRLKSLEGRTVYAKLGDIPETIHTLSVYVGADNSNKLENEIVALKAQRIIFNPGTENPHLQMILAQACPQVLEACTLVLLSTKQF